MSTRPTPRSCGDLHALDADHRKTHPDIAIAEIAARQRGVVSAEQLRTVGLARGAIANRLAIGRFHRLHKGVYLVGHFAPAPLARETAALLACGPDAVLSHRSAASVWRLMGSWKGDVEVTVAGRDCGPRKGVRHRRTKELDSRDVRRHAGLPVTAPARTLLDVANLIDDRDLERTLNEAFVLRLTTMRELHAAMLRSRGRPGAPKLRALLGRIEGRGITRSEAERQLERLLGRSGLPAPETNVMVGPYEVDMLWRSAGLVVEVDGWAFHSTRSAFERDRARDADLQAHGLRVLRFTWRQIIDQPDVVVARLTQLLKR